MIRLDVQQGSPEWVDARLGIPTASQFSRIITTTGKLSGQSDGYAHQLIAEQMLGFPLDDASSGFMDRGVTGEQRALRFYELQRNTDTERVGFVLRNDRRVGCSPDFLVGDKGLGEIKVPAAHTHIGYLLDDQGIGYKAQVQGQLWICEREWSDTVSYHDTLPSAIVRQSRDEGYIKKLAAAVDQFLSFIDESKLKLMRLGYLPKVEVPGLRIVA